MESMAYMVVLFRSTYSSDRQKSQNNDIHPSLPGLHMSLKSISFS